MIKRPENLAIVKRALRRARVVVLVGPRQCGKTTLARELVAASSANYFDLEDPAAAARLAEPMTALSPLRKLVVIDEVQRRPELFPVLRVLSDRRPLPARFLVLGSASPQLLRQTSESLAGRVEVLELGGLDLSEVGARRLTRRWLRGGFPLAFLARSESDSAAWRRDFILTSVERDMPQLGFGIAPAAMRRFWTMLAHYHGQIWNAADPARSLGVSEPTVRRYLDVLEGLFMIRQLRPWHANLKKRQVKSPKVFLRDTGLLHQLLGIRTGAELLSHPKCGASWEGFAIDEAIRAVRPDEAYFWGTHNGAELDLLLVKDGRRYGVECKRKDAPRLTTSMRIARADLGIEHLAVVYPGETAFPLAEDVTAVPMAALAEAGAAALLAPKGRSRR